MTAADTEAALLRAVLDRPDDDLPRLIYADWLDEQSRNRECDHCGGDGYTMLEVQVHVEREFCGPCRGTGRVSDGLADRAEFIRVQCELAKVQNHKCGTAHFADICPIRRNREALRRRERELWAELDLSDLPGSGLVRSVESWVSTSVARYDFRRGFAESIALDSATFLAHAPALFRAAPIREVRLSDKERRSVVHFTEHGSSVFGWANDPGWGHRPSFVESEIWSHMDLTGTISKDGYHCWDTQAAALAALSAACVAHGRAAALTPRPAAAARPSPPSP